MVLLGYKRLVVRRRLLRAGRQDGSAIFMSTPFLRCPSIEDYRQIGTPTLIADDFFHAGCVLGCPTQIGDGLI